MYVKILKHRCFFKKMFLFSFYLPNFFVIKKKSHVFLKFYIFFYVKFRFGLAVFFFPYISNFTRVVYKHDSSESANNYSMSTTFTPLLVSPTVNATFVAISDTLYVSPLAWIFLIILMTVTQCSSVLALTSIMVLINNSCYVDKRATVNGLGQSGASLGRLLGPFLSGLCFAWSQRNGLPWPLDYHFTFLLIVCIVCFSGYTSFFLDPSLDKKKVQVVREENYQLEELDVEQTHGAGDDIDGKSCAESKM